MHDSELSCILPHLIDKSGHKSEKHKAAFQATLSIASTIIAPGERWLVQSSLPVPPPDFLMFIPVIARPPSLPPLLSKVSCTLLSTLPLQVSCAFCCCRGCPASALSRGLVAYRSTHPSRDFKVPYRVSPNCFITLSYHVGAILLWFFSFLPPKWLRFLITILS